MRSSYDDLSKTMRKIRVTYSIVKEKEFEITDEEFNDIEKTIWLSPTFKKFITQEDVDIVSVEDEDGFYIYEK